METALIIVGSLLVGVLIIVLLVRHRIKSQQKAKEYERGLKMVPMLIHLPPATDDIAVGGRDERDVVNEALSQAQVMYSIISSTLTKGFKSKIYGQRHLSFEIVAANGLIKYYAVVPAVIRETVRQAILSAYPTAKLEITDEESIFTEQARAEDVAGGQLELKKEFVYPISTYEESQRDASLAILNAMAAAKEGEGMAIQILLRPTDGSWVQNSTDWVQNLKSGKKNKGHSANFVYNFTQFFKEALFAFWRPPEEHEKEEEKPKELSALKQEEIAAIEKKTKTAGFETLIRVIASAKDKARSEALAQSLVAAFSQFDSQENNGFKYKPEKDAKKLTIDYLMQFFPKDENKNILNSVELATLFHLPAQNVIPTSQVERQATKQVEAPAKVPEKGVILGINEFRGEEKVIRLDDNDRRRHTYMIGATGSGKSVLLKNVAFQDMCDGRGFAFIDPHGDAVEELMGKVPVERRDDVIYFDPADMEHPMGMNMFEFTTPDQKDFIVQEGINMLQSLFDPSNQGFFGPRGQHMFRNAALLLMSDPNGATFIDIPQCFTDPEFVKQKLQYVTDKAVYDYWTKEFPASQKSNDAGEVITWFTSKWGPFLSNVTMRNILGQTKSGFNIRKIMDERKIFLVNLSKGRLGDINSQLLGMILVMKFQAAAMSRADIPEDERQDFCLFVDEFQNFATESFESILSEARKYHLNLFLANQFMTQLTDKIREGILGNVGTLMAGRLGVTDAELMQKAFQPVFNAEDLHRQENFKSIATVMMFNSPSSPFTMNMVPPMGKMDLALMQEMKALSARKYARTRAEVEEEIRRRWTVAQPQEVENGAGGAQSAGNGVGGPQGAGNGAGGLRRAGNDAERPQGAENGPRKPQEGPEEARMGRQAQAGSDGASRASEGPQGGFLEAWRKRKAELKQNGATGATKTTEAATAPKAVGAAIATEVNNAAGLADGANATGDAADKVAAQEDAAVFRVHREKRKR